jgi:hypothetical protein
MGKVIPGFTREENTAEAKRIIAERTPELVAWLESEGLSVEDWGNQPWGRLLARYSAAGQKVAAQMWVRQAKLDAMRMGVTDRRDVASKIVTRFLEARMTKSGETLTPMLRQQMELSHMQPHVRWVVQHPIFQLPKDARPGVCSECGRFNLDPVQRACVKQYERVNPAPNDAALTLFQQCQQKPALLHKLLEESAKSIKQSNVSDGKLTEEQKRVEDLKGDLAALKARAEKVNAK